MGFMNLPRIVKEWEEEDEEGMESENDDRGEEGEVEEEDDDQDGGAGEANPRSRHWKASGGGDCIMSADEIVRNAFIGNELQNQVL